MDLFSSQNQKLNLLPQDGEVYYLGPVLTLALRGNSEETARNRSADEYYDSLLNKIAWQQDEAIMFGKRILTKRKVAWYGDEAFLYRYSNTTKTALRWTKELLELKKICEEASGETYNSCLLNLYHDGSEGMAYHSDAEPDLKKHGAIASLSLGAERKFAFKHKKTKERIDVILEHGSLLIMKGETQDHWMHRLPPTKRKLGPRVNLTFRTIG